MIDQVSFLQNPTTRLEHYPRVLGQHGAMAIAALVLEYRYLGKAVTLVGLDPDTEEVCNHILSIQISNSQL